jgi:hypothetical protein
VDHGGGIEPRHLDSEDCCRLVDDFTHILPDDLEPTPPVRYRNEFLVDGDDPGNGLAVDKGFG